MTKTKRAGKPAAVRTHPVWSEFAPTGSGLSAWLLGLAQYEQSAAAGCAEQAALVYKLVKSSGKWPGGVDKMWTARKLRRRMMRATAGHEANGAAYLRTRRELHEVLAKAAGKGFDPTK